MPGFQPQWPCGPAGSLANMGITIPPRMQPPQLQLGNGSRMQMPQPQPPSQTAAIETGVQFGYQMATLQHTCQQQAGALQQQASRLDLLEACQMSEPTCDYHTDTLKQEGLLKQGGLLFCRLHLSHAGASFIGANALHVLNYMMSGILSPDGIQQATPRAQNQTARTALRPRSRRPLANDQEPQFFYTFTIGGVLLCVRMCHILILPYTHQGGIPPYTPRRHTSFMSIGALVKNKNSSCEDANTGEEEADEGSQVRWVFF